MMHMQLFFFSAISFIKYKLQWQILAKCDTIIEALRTQAPEFLGNLQQDIQLSKEGLLIKRCEEILG